MPNVRSTEKSPSGRRSSGRARRGPRVEPAIAMTRKKKEMLTPLVLRSAIFRQRLSGRDASIGRPIKRIVCNTRSFNGTVWWVKAKVMTGTRRRPIRYRIARETTVRLVSPRKYEVIGTTASASWEISLEYDGNPPVAKPTTRPLATIVGKLRHGRNTLAARQGRVEKLADSDARGAPELPALAGPRIRVDGTLRPATEFRQDRSPK